MKIRLFKPSVGQEELDSIRDVFDRSWLGLGPLVGQFEKEWSTYIGAANSVGVNSGTAALHLALTAFGFPAGSKVLVPAMTFIATASVVLCNGLEPVFVDCDRETLGMDLEDLKRKITPDCVAVIPVHFGGHPVPMDQLLEIARSHGLAVVEDCAHCAGGSYQGRKLGTWGDIGCFSFEEKKCMTTGDGGMISSNNVELIEPLRAYRWVGIDKDTWKREAAEKGESAAEARHWYYDIAVLGYKYNMNDLMASIGLVQLKKLDRMNGRRMEIIARYLNGIEECRTVRSLLPYDLRDNAYWLFGVRCDRRDDLILHMRSRDIATGVHFTPLPLHPLFRDNQDPIPTAEAVYPTIITLPLHVDLTDEEVDYVVQAVCDFDRN